MGAPVLTSLVRTSASPYLYTAEFTHTQYRQRQDGWIVLAETLRWRNWWRWTASTERHDWSNIIATIMVIWHFESMGASRRRLHRWHVSTRKVESAGGHDTNDRARAQSASPWQIDANLGNATRVVHLIKTNPTRHTLIFQNR